MQLTPTELALVYRGLARLESAHRPQLFQDSYDVHELTVQLQQRVKRELEKTPHSADIRPIRQFFRTLIAIVLIGTVGLLAVYSIPAVRNSIADIFSPSERVPLFLIAVSCFCCIAVPVEATIAYRRKYGTKRD